MTPARESWFEDDGGPLVRPYAVVGGRSGGVRHELDIITLVVAARQHVGTDRLGPEHNDILHICSQPLSVAEVAAHLRLPLIVTKILICDLIDQGFLTYRRAPAPDAVAHDVNLLHEVLNGIRNL
ncbi:DUF742 domain-containing protein [Nocardia sp. NPDC004123]